MQKNSAVLLLALIQGMAGRKGATSVSRRFCRRCLDRRPARHYHAALTSFVEAIVLTALIKILVDVADKQLALRMSGYDRGAVQAARRRGRSG